MLRATWAAKWYLILGLLAFLIILLVNTPIHFVWQYVERSASGLPVRISQPAGTLWDGQARLMTPQSGNIDVHWTLSPLSLLTGTAALNLVASGEHLNLEGEARAGGIFSGGLPETIAVSGLSGFLDGEGLSPYLMSVQTTLTGDFTLSGVNADFSLADKSLNSASGQLVYSGGRLEAPVQRQRISTDLPMLIADVVTEGDRFLVPVKTEEGQPLGELFLQNDGWGGVSVLKRALDVVGQPWLDKQATADTVVFEVSQKIL
ncbi:MAG: hypothetical protein CSH36_07825 [Thalassolituus sp.]|nr:MAG: hypothetical protein CSH36_07825 [Thalassolituus sp.]